MCDAIREQYMAPPPALRSAGPDPVIRAARSGIFRWLLEPWDRGLRHLETVALVDRLVAIRKLAWEEPRPSCRSAIIDGVRDMTLVGAQFVRGLVFGKPGRKLRRTASWS